jgi:hypothetical protein
MKVQDVMKQPAVCCSPDTNVGAAVELLWVNNCGMLPVVGTDGKLQGVVTDRDICIAMGTRNRLAGELTIREIACLWRIDTVTVKRSDPRNALQLRKRTPDDFILGFCRVDRMPQRARIFEKSGSRRCLIEGPTVWLPSKRAGIGNWS